MTSHKTESGVFINYFEKDGSHAYRLFSDLRAASLNPWIDKENLLPGQNKKNETEKAIKESDFFIALLSRNSVEERGDVQSQIKLAKEVLSEIPESQVYLVPARLDDVVVPFGLKDITPVDLFPAAWEEGLKKILRALKIEPKLIDLVITHQGTVSPFISLPDSGSITQIQIFKGEKQFFVGRQNCIHQIIRDKLVAPGSKVSVVGLGGSGKSQLAFKAMHEYMKEGIFDLVVPIYFDEGLLPFDIFLLQMAEIMGVKADNFESNTTIERRKGIIRGLLNNKKHPLIYLDNFETVSMILNKQTSSETKESIQNANQITDFLNNIVPIQNTSILVTSRERRNNLSNEELIDLEGLNIEESIKLFNAFVRPEFKNLKGNTRVQIVEILKKTGGHPLTVEIIARNLRGVHQLEDIPKNLFNLKGDPTQPEARFQTLEACVDYTIKKLDNKLQEFLSKLTLFKSPFPISAAVKIFGVSENEVLDLFDRSLLKLVDSDELYGKIQDPQYWLYNFHPSVRGYVEDVMNKNKQSHSDQDGNFGENFSRYYSKLISDTYDSVGKENHVPALARFNIICQGKENDFERAAELTTDKQSAYILSYLGLVISELGMSSKALNYHKKALEIDESLNDRVGMGEDYTNIGFVLSNMGNYQHALDCHKRALEIHEGLNDRVGIRRDYTNIGLVLGNIYNYQEALDYQKRALEIHEGLNNKVGMALNYRNMGNVLHDIGNNPQALDYQKRALEIHEGLNDRVEMGGDYSNIGNVFRIIGKYQEALDCHKRALEIRTGLNDRVGKGRDYTNIGNVFRNMGNYPQALDYHKKALEIHEGLNDRIGMGIHCSNIGLVLYKMGNYPQALDYHKKALEIHEGLNDRVRKVIDYNNIGLVLRR